LYCLTRSSWHFEKKSIKQVYQRYSNALLQKKMYLKMHEQRLGSALAAAHYDRLWVKTKGLISGYQTLSQFLSMPFFLASFCLHSFRFERLV
jgi:hypothetical protein